MAVVYDAERDKWGFIDKSEKVAIPLHYDLASDFSEGLAGLSPNCSFFMRDSMRSSVSAL
jgi:hypothetical protein